jgi:NAD(P)-dependent dehydrogenase (short-subunit alcohol dehydrogenase family)
MPTVLITSANRGLGREFVEQYSRNGWTVLATCRDPKAATDLNALRASHASIRVTAMDVTDAASVRDAAASIGREPIDLLLNTAGVMGPSRKQSVGTIDYKAWLEVFDANSLGPMRVLEAFLDNVLASQRKLAVAITSGMGSLADNTSGGFIAYRSSKAALNMAMRSASLELASKGLICVVMNPGWVRTDMGGASAPLAVEDSIASMIATIEKLDGRANGHFLNYDGEEYPW